MSRGYELHVNGDCGDWCRVCEWEDLNEPEDENEEEDDE